MINFHNLSPEVALAESKSSYQGLSAAEAKKRQVKFGLNSLPAAKPIGRLRIFLTQFKSPLVYILLGAAIISILVKEYIDAEVILTAVLINTIIGYIQENKANNSLEQLKKVVEYKALVIRDGREQELDSINLVPGDIIVLRAGQKVPADARILSCVDLQINEASLTGESLAIFKTNQAMSAGTVLADRKNMAYSATEVLSGTGQALVVAIGANTEIGQIAQMVAAAKEAPTPLQERLAKLSRLFGIIVGVISVMIVVVGWLQGRNFFDIFITAIAVAVASIPEGLIVAVTVILVLGMKQILKRKALTRKLVAAETLGSITVICSDKTGTLTEGNMRLAHMVAGGQEISLAEFKLTAEKQDFLAIVRNLEIGLLCNNAIVENSKSGLLPEKMIGQPTEVALLAAGLDLGLEREKLLTQEPRLAELPFNSDNKFMVTLHQKVDSYVIYEKGAPEFILAKSKFVFSNNGIKELGQSEKDLLLSQYENFTSQGLRVIATAYRDLDKLPWSLEEEHKDWKRIDNDLVFVGLIAFKDPLRAEARDAILECRQAGIRPILITGDHKLTAHAIALEVGLDGKAEDVITGDILEQTDDLGLRRLVRKHNIFARVSPGHKLRIVEALKHNNEVVAMTGDGLNDSPALKAADIGVCLGSGTDVAKETSDLVLLDNNFQVIVSAIKEGRIIFWNIRKSITYLISDCFSEVVLVAGSIFFGLPLAILPTQILWINIVNDGFPNFSLAFERSENNVMNQKPIGRHEPLISREMKIIIIWLGLFRDSLLLLAFIYLHYHSEAWGWDLKYLRTFFFALLGVKSLTAIFSLRSFSLSIFRINHGHNRYLLGAFFFSLILLILAIYLPLFQGILQTKALGVNAWLLILLAAFINILMMESVKYFFNHKRHA